MKVLLTGAFGNVGFYTIQALLEQGHSVRCFDVRNAFTEKRGRKVADKVEIVWGDITDPDTVAKAVAGQDVVIHMAFIIPPAVDRDLERAEAVNMGGTRNVLAALKSQSPSAKLLFISTFDVYGHTQQLQPPRTVDDPVQATDAYSRQKIQCEELVRDSGLEWAIFRFCDMPPLQNPHKPQPIMFTIPLDQRFEMLHPADAALAVARGITAEIWGKIWLIGGGPSCQVRYEDYLQGVMERMGIGKLPANAFTTEPYCTDWLDSSASQTLLNYQRHSFEQILEELVAASAPPRIVRLLIPLVRRPIQRSILKMSPYVKIS